MPPAPEIRAGVWVDPSAQVAGRIGPHCFIGPEASIAEGATVDDSVVCAGSRIGTGGVIRGSVLMPGAEVGSNAVVEDSIVGPRALIGDGARLGGMTIVGVGAEVPAGSVLDGSHYPSS
jgi:NDP-sugar pyrophosphorylase family protein